MPWHYFEQHQAAKERKNERSEKPFPRFLRADVGTHQVSTDCAAGQIGTHVAELGDRDQIQNVKLSRHDSVSPARSKIKDFRNEVEKPQDIKQPEYGVGHRLQRLVVAKPREHLS